MSRRHSKRSQKKRKLRKAQRHAPLQRQLFPLAMVRDAQRKTTAAIMQEGRTLEKLCEAVVNACEFGDELTAIMRSKMPSGHPKTACRAGCSWCCSLVAESSVPEVLAIARYLRETLDADQLAVCLSEIERVLEERRSGRRPQCPLLKDGLCTVYPIRPLTCRAWNSYDADACRTYAETGRGVAPVNLIQMTSYLGIGQGMDGGLAQAGLSALRVELLRGLRVALSAPDAEGRYLAGEAVFADAKWRPEYADPPPGQPSAALTTTSGQDDSGATSEPGRLSEGTLP